MGGTSSSRSTRASTACTGKLLALHGASVRSVALGSDGIVVGVRRRARLHACPRCSFRCHARYDRTHCEWRHISLGNWRITLRAVLCRLVCPEHGVWIGEGRSQATAGCSFDELGESPAHEKEVRLAARVRRIVRGRLVARP